MSLYFFIANNKEDNDFITFIKENKDHHGRLFIRTEEVIMFPSLSKERFDRMNKIETQMINLEELKREYLKFTLLNKGEIRR